MQKSRRRKSRPAPSRKRRSVKSRPRKSKKRLARKKAKRKKRVLRVRYRDVRTKRIRDPGHFSPGEEVYVETLDHKNRVVSRKKSKIRAYLIRRKQLKRSLVFEGSNRGKRFEDVIRENKLDKKLTARAGRGKRLLLIEIETALPTGEIIRATRTVVLASKGVHKTEQNRMILLKNLIHTLDGKGIKIYAKKFRKGASKRTPTGDFRKTSIRLYCLVGDNEK